MSNRTHQGQRWITRLAVAGLIALPCVPAVGATLPAKPGPEAGGVVFLQPSHAGGPVRCSDRYYEYLPGLLNFCLGVHDWESGRYQNAIGWLKLAAGWGSKGAQYMLGLAYYRGNHVAMNRPLGLAWLQLANERHNNLQIETVTRAALRFATPDEQRRADAILAGLRKHDGDKVAATRAWKQYVHYGELVAYELGGGLGDPNSGCVLVKGRCTSVDAFNGVLGAVAKHYFKGWTGRVTVEPLQQLPAAPKPTKLPASLEPTR